MDGTTAFQQFLKPKLAERLRAIGLDVEYHRAQGDYLYYRDPASAREVAVLDLVGGFGAALLGHNHPEIVACAREVLEAARPMHAQASVRETAGRLAGRLAERVGAITGRRYVVTLANSGAEAVEAAIKHAELERRGRIAQIQSETNRQAREIRARLADGTGPSTDELLRNAAAAFGVDRIASVADALQRLRASVAVLLERSPLYLALVGAFHGKTTGALQLTASPEYRSPWERIGIRSAFLAPGDGDALSAAVASETLPYHALTAGPDGIVRLAQRRFVNVAACFVEPIQGEGGVREIAAADLRLLRDAADAAGFPLVFDEIQCGMGRTGTFLASESSGVRADYYLLSKSLGGGLAKISALLVEAERYDLEFGALHTSTFADDDFSSSIALKVLEIIERDDLIRRCGEKGAYFLDRLRALQARFPDQVRDVRGRGLLIGVELAPQADSPSPLLRALSEQNVLAALAAGYLLHEERIRVAPTLSGHATIRLEPSAYVTRGSLDRACEAFERWCAAVRDADVYRLTRFLAGRARVDAPPSPRPPRHRREVSAAVDTDAQVGFLSHFVEPGDLRRWEPGLAPLSDDECERFIRRARAALEPFVAGRTELRSATGARAHITIIGLPFTPAEAVEALQAGTDGWARDLIDQGVALARELGCSVVGFGAYTSIVTRNCRTIAAPDLSITSGNSLTAAAALDALFQAARSLELIPRRLGVVGAAGNVGKVLAQVAAEDVDRIVLIGGDRAVERLRRAAAEIYADAWERLTSNPDAGGIARPLARTSSFAVLERRTDDAATIGAELRRALDEELGPEAPVVVAMDLDALRDCNLIISATNAPRPVILPQHLADVPLVVADVAMPRDVDLRVLAVRPRALVLRGGLVHAPLGQEVDFEGASLAPGQVYGCLAEAVLLGFAGITRDYSFGTLTPHGVRTIRRLARLHGFTVEIDPVAREIAAEAHA